MDRTARRKRRTVVRSRHTKIGVAVVTAAAAIAVLLTSTLGGAQESPAKPPPKVDEVDLTPDPAPVGAGWEGQVGTDANLVGVQWNGDPGAEFTVEVRNGRGEWRQASDIGANDAVPDPGSPDATAAAARADTQNVSEPIWVGRDVSGVRVRLDNGTAADVALHVVDSTRGKVPEKNLESTGAPEAPTAPAPTEPGAPAPPETRPPTSAGGTDGGGAPITTPVTTPPVEQGLGLGPSLAVAALAALAVAFIVRRRRALAVLIAAVVLVGSACAPTKGGGGGSTQPVPDAIVARSQWAPDLPWNWDACPGGPEYSYVGTAIVHHTVNSNAYGPGDSAGIMRGIWAYHVQSLGYCDIAYNFIVDNYGTPFEGRLGGIDQPVVGAHAIGANYGTTGVAVLGTFSSVSPSGGALGTLENVIRWKLYIHGANPFDDPAADILGHRDTSQTECPGDVLYNYLPYTRHYVKLYW
jgi:N-acetylmuramoyl-L-alanine amidase